MSQYYHSFSFGFNLWYIVAPLLAVAMIVFEVRAYRLNLRTLCIYRTHNDRATLMLSGVFTSLVTMMVVAESSDGIIQYFDNGLGKYESPYWSCAGLIIAVAIFFIVYWAALFFIGKAAAYAKCGYLHKKRLQYGIARRYHQEMMARRKNSFALPENQFAKETKKKENPRV